ncbi:MAG: hypothetical protein HY754_15820 [Nitrospirae bacterium]|nr:hypothetical protein [Nitrospirota bacterium]
MPKVIRHELAKAGVFGESGTVVTADDLKEVFETFQGKAPITPGHTLADWMPAMGFVTEVSYDPKTTVFIGEKIELSDILADTIDEKLFGNWSIGIRRRKSDGKKYLHHLAVLGAVPPQIKDLKILDMPFINMADDADTEERWTFKLSDANNSKWGVMGDILRRLRDAFVADKGVEEADKIINTWEIETIKSVEESQTDDVYAADHKSNKEEKEMSDKDKDKGKENIELADAVQKNKKLEDALRSSKKDALRAAISGKVPAAKTELVMQLADALPVEDAIELSDDKGGKRKVSAVDILTEIFRALPLPVNPGETDMGDAAGQGENDVNGSKVLKNV